MKRIIAYIDGFNFYHPIDDYLKLTTEQGKPCCLKWLNYWSLVESLINRETEKLEKVLFFTAVSHDLGQESVDRHLAYINALEAKNVTVIYGKFKKRYAKCKVQQCSHSIKIFQTREEKRTDVNIAVNLVGDCYKDKFDRAILFSADTDLVPAIEVVKAEGKEVTPARLMHLHEDFNTGKKFFSWPINNQEITQAAGTDFERIKWNKLKKHLLPQEVQGKVGIIKMPHGYMSKEDFAT